MQETNPKHTVYAINSSILHKGVDLLNLFICLYLSDILVGNAVVGCALYISALIWISFGRVYRSGLPKKRKKRVFWTTLIVFLLAAGIDTVILIYYPSITGNLNAWLMAGYASLLAARSILTDIYWYRSNEARPRKLFRFTMLHLAFMGVALALILVNISNAEQRLISIIGFFLGSVLLYFRQLFSQDQQKIFKEGEEARPEINAYDIYGNMALYSYMAFYLSIITSIIYVLYTPQIDLQNDFWWILLWMGLVFGVTFLLYRTIVMRRVQKTEKSIVFLVGALCWIFASLMLYDNLFHPQLLLLIGWGVLWGLGIACMYAVLTTMKEELKLVAALIDEDIQHDELQQRTELSQNLALMFSGVILLALLAALSIMGGKGDVYDFSTSPVILGYFKFYINYLPFIFVLISLVFAGLQPLNRRYYEKLEKFAKQQGEERPNPALKKRLRHILVKQDRVRLGIRILRFFFRPLFRHKLYGVEHVDVSQGPVIFTCNHGEIYGPLVTTLYLPFFFRPWIINKMVDKTLIEAHMYKGTFEPIKWLPKALGRGITRCVAPIVVWMLRSMDPIPVFRDNSREVIRTMRMSVEALEYEDNLLIFPENPDITESGRYAQKGVVPFYTGFIHIARDYYRKTGNCVWFYPVYADKTRRRITIGQGIQFRPDIPFQEEKQRIANYLEDTTNHIAFEE